jgi:subtilase family serine protease
MGPLAASASTTTGSNGGSNTIPTGQTIMSQADNNNRFTESNETNNTLSRVITVP